MHDNNEQMYKVLKRFKFAMLSEDGERIESDNCNTAFRIDEIISIDQIPSDYHYTVLKDKGYIKPIRTKMVYFWAHNRLDIEPVMFEMSVVGHSFHTDGWDEDGNDAKGYIDCDMFDALFEQGVIARELREAPDGKI